MSGNNGEVLPELPDGWEWTTIDSVVMNVQYGYTAKAIEGGSGPKYLRITDIQNGLVDWNGVPSCEIESRAVPNYRLESGDIVFARTGATTGKSYLIRDCPESIFASYLIRLKNNPTIISDEYLYAFFQSLAYWSQINKEAKGTGQPGLNASILRTLSIPLPPLPEQYRIVAKIESLFQEVKTARESLSRIQPMLKNFRQSVLAKAFRGELVPQNPEDEPASVLLERIQKERKEKLGKKYKEAEPVDAAGLPELPGGWSWANLGFVSDIIMGQSPPGSSYNQDGDGTPLVNGPVEFGPGPFSYTIKVKWTTETTKLCKKDDLLLCVRGSTTGRINIAGFDACIGRGVAAIRSDVSQWYLNYFIHSIRQNIFDMGTGSTFPNITIDDVRTYPAPVPPLPEQHRIVAKIEELFTLADQAELALESARKRADRMEQAILGKAFRGELVKQEAGEEKIWKKKQRKVTK